ncbi:MAG: A/G-specific adenine glycosylase [Bergeyella sp.]
MKSSPQSDLRYIGEKLLRWYDVHGRDLPFRNTKNPYHIWISEIIFQQTRIRQGIRHYENFVERFPDVHSLYEAENDEVLLYWKGLGYYSRALNLHKASVQIVEDFGGKFPEKYDDILKLKGVGKYTASAISSISFGEQIPAVDGNFYRVLSRIFASDFDISKPSAFSFFSELAYRIMPDKKAGDFNQAMMDIGSEICKPKNPLCMECPLNEDCIAYQTGTISLFPVKTKKVKTENLELQYYFVSFGKKFLIKRRGDNFIWKRLYEFPDSVPENFKKFRTGSETVLHKLTHKNLTVHIDHIEPDSFKTFEEFAVQNGFLITDKEKSDEKSFPKPLESYLSSHCKND